MWILSETSRLAQKRNSFVFLAVAGSAFSGGFLCPVRADAGSVQIQSVKQNVDGTIEITCATQQRGVWVETSSTQKKEAGEVCLSRPYRAELTCTGLEFRYPDGKQTGTDLSGKREFTFQLESDDPQTSTFVLLNPAIAPLPLETLKKEPSCLAEKEALPRLALELLGPRSFGSFNFYKAQGPCSSVFAMTRQNSIFDIRFNYNFSGYSSSSAQKDLVNLECSGTVDVEARD